MLLSLLSWLRPQTPRKRPARRPTYFRPMLESLGERIVPSGVGSPHFIQHDLAASINNAGALTVSFKEAGLAAGATETIQIQVLETATAGYINGGGNHPKASNKETVSMLETASGTFTAGQNGNLVGSLTLQPTTPPPALPIPQGQTWTLLSVSCTDVVLTDLTSGATASIPGTFSATLVNL